MLPLLTVCLLSIASKAADDGVLEERIDLYDPASGAYLGSKTTWYAPDGRRLRRVHRDGSGAATLRFLVLHDADSRELEAWYFEGDAIAPDRETFSYREGTKVTTYYDDAGEVTESLETVFDERGRESSKRFLRANGETYGEEQVLWTESGLPAGWDFRYVKSGTRVAFRYAYDLLDTNGTWLRRTRSRDGMSERIEVCTRVIGAIAVSTSTPARLAPGVISTERSETSPSVTRDGKTLVFARYGDDWERKRPYLARLGGGG